MNVTDIPSPPPASARTALLAKRFARTIEVIAGVLFVAAVWEAWQLTYSDTNRFFGTDTGTPKVSGSTKLAQFLQLSLTNLTWIALLLAAAFALEVLALRSIRLPEPPRDPFAPDRAVQAEDTSPAIPRAGSTAVPPIVPRREAPITAAVTSADDSVWRR